MDTQLSGAQPHLARSLAAEDLRCGDYVAVLSETYEIPSFLWCHDSLVLSPHEPVRVQFRTRNAGEPRLVKAICLPFVFVKTAGGQYQTLDVRLCQLARLDRDYARQVWKKLRKQRK